MRAAPAAIAIHRPIGRFMGAALAGLAARARSGTRLATIVRMVVRVMDELSLAVVGIDFPNRDKAGTNRRSELLMTIPGERVELRPEPRNRHDEHAVGVWSARGIQLGYLSAERAPWIGRRLRSGEKAMAVFQGLAGSAATIRIRFGGGLPTLPAPAASRSSPAPAVLPRTGEDDGFDADPDGPDWGA